MYLLLDAEFLNLPLQKGTLRLKAYNFVTRSGLLCTEANEKLLWGESEEKTSNQDAKIYK
jgi:hypothetical protein